MGTYRDREEFDFIDLVMLWNEQMVEEHGIWINAPEEKKRAFIKKMEKQRIERNKIREEIRLSRDKQ